MILGIELGSTRIKSVLVNKSGTVIATGGYEWENRLENGFWTYSLDEVEAGLQGSFADLKINYENLTGEKLTSVDAIGISGMMHGYLAFDDKDELLTPFRTWRNTNTGEAAELLSRELDFNMPLRWSASHLLQAVINGEEHIERVAFMTTLAGYVHYKLTGERVLGMGDAAGMFPLKNGEFDAERLAKFDNLLKNKFGVDKKLGNLLPKILPAGEIAGRLTEDGARFLDPTGSLSCGVPFCPPEGDADTGMVATNSVRKGTGNVSAGTSAFAMFVLEKSLSKAYPEVDIAATPDGSDVAMIHVANCTSEINAWAELFSEVLALGGVNMSKGELFTALFEKSRECDADVGGLTSFNFLSGEHVWGLAEGRPMVIRHPSGKLDLASFMKSQIYSAVASLRRGMDILSSEGVSVSEMCGHGGYFKTPVIGQSAMSAALKAPITVMDNAGEGGAWGMALLALYCLEGGAKIRSLADFLDGIFGDVKKTTVSADADEVARFERYMERYGVAVAAERVAADVLK